LVFLPGSDQRRLLLIPSSGRNVSMLSEEKVVEVLEAYD